MDRSIAAEKFGDTILWEQPIQIVASDYIAPGDLVIDVGGNVGGLSIAFSRMTGATGRVISLECNPEILPVMKRTLEINQINNVELVERAAYSQSNLTLSFQVDPSLYSSGSRLTTDINAATLAVRTVSLNDIARHAGRIPSFIKIDVEGAEFDVLEGSNELLSNEDAPSLVLEYAYQADKSRCPLALLASYGYEFWDVYLYDRISRAFYAEMDGMTNILALPPRLQGMGYRKDTPKLETEPSQIKLPAGRSVVRLHFEGDPLSIARVGAWDSGGHLLTMCETNLRAMLHHAHSSFVFDLKEPTTIRFALETVSGSPITWRGAQVHEVNIEASHNPDLSAS